MHSVDSWPYRITVDRPEWPEIQTWCETNIGRFDEDWYKLGMDPAEYLESGHIRTVWVFRRHQDAMLFTLRWT